MSALSPDQPPPGAPTLCLGEAVVELICQRAVESVSDADAFVPRFGGAAATAAVVAARNGARVSFAGAAGDDAWGRWLRDRLRREGVEVCLFELVPGGRTPVAIVALDRQGEPSGSIYGDLVGSRPDEGLEDLVRASAAVFVSCSGPDHGEIVLRAREVALLKAGARMVAIRLGHLEGVMLRGELRLDVDGVPVSVISTIGAGDVFTGVLLARLATSAFHPAAAGASLPVAVAEAARACERWGALD